MFSLLRNRHLSFLQDHEIVNLLNVVLTCDFLVLIQVIEHSVQVEPIEHDKYRETTATIVKTKLITLANPCK